MNNLIEILRSRLEERGTAFMVDRETGALVLPFHIAGQQMEVTITESGEDCGIITRFPLIVPARRLKPTAELCCRFNERLTIGAFVVSFEGRTLSHQLWYPIKGDECGIWECVEMFDRSMPGIRTTVSDAVEPFLKVAHTGLTPAHVFVQFARRIDGETRKDRIAAELLDTESIHLN